MANIQRIASKSLATANKRVMIDSDSEVYTLSASDKGNVTRKSSALSKIFDAFGSYFKANCLGSRISHALDLMPKQERDLKIRHQLWEDGDFQAYLDLETIYLVRTREMFEKVNALIKEINENEQVIIILTVNRKLKGSQYIYCESEEIIDIVMAIYYSKQKNLVFYLIIQDRNIKNEEIKILDITRSHNSIPVKDEHPMYGIFDAVGVRNSTIEVYAFNPFSGHRKSFKFKLDQRCSTEKSLLDKCFYFDLEDRVRQRDGLLDRNCYQFDLGQKVFPLNKEKLNSSQKHLFNVSISTQKGFLEQLRLDF